MKRISKKEINLNTLSTGCAPCINEANKIKKKINNRNVSKINIDEIKKLLIQSLNKKLKVKYNILAPLDLLQ